MSLFERNCILLQNDYPELVEALRAYREDGRILLEMGERGAWTARWVRGNRQILLHSAFDPVREARTAFEERDYRLFSSVFLIGGGLGYYWQEALQRTQQGCVVYICEPNIGMLAAALSVTDLAPMLKTGDLVFIWGAPEEMRGQLDRQWRDLTKLAKLRRLQIIDFPPFKREEPELCQAMHTMIVELAKYARLIVGNAISDTLYGIMNTFKNLKYIERAPSLKKIAGTFPHPVVILAAGPSLDKNIHWIKEYQGRITIFAVDTIVQKILNAGIVPDAVFALERGEIIYDWFFEKLEAIPENTLMIGASVVDPRVFAKFADNSLAFLRSEDGMQQEFAKMMGEETMMMGLSVAHLAFSAARSFGMNPIILVGQDLAYGADGSTHSQDTHYDEAEERPKTDEDEWIEGYYGQPVRTTKIWRTFRDWFELEISRTEATVINATEGGARIHGATEMALREALSRYTTDEPKHSLREHVLNFREDEALVEKKRILREGLQERYHLFENYKEAIRRHVKKTEDIDKNFSAKSARERLDRMEETLIEEFSDSWLHYAYMPELANLLERIIEIRFSEPSTKLLRQEAEAFKGFYLELGEYLDLMTRLMEELKLVTIKD